MKLARPFSRPARLLLTLALLGVLAFSAGCVYRVNIQQGNLLKTSDVDQVVPGMTRSQVRYLLGTPMVADPFDPQRWDYIYTFRRGRDRRTDRAHFVVHFEGDKVSRVERLDNPENLALEPPKQRSWKFWQKDEAPVPAETIPESPPTAPGPTEAPGTPTSPPSTPQT
jgi:outer membrane protein assembly factor BamE